MSGHLHVHVGLQLAKQLHVFPAIISRDGSAKGMQTRSVSLLNFFQRCFVRPRKTQAHLPGLDLFSQ